MNKSEIQIFTSQDDNTEIKVHLDQDSVWLSLNQMVDLFARDKSVISRHINNIFREHELEKSSVVAKNATTAADGKELNPSIKEKDIMIKVNVNLINKLN